MGSQASPPDEQAGPAAFGPSLDDNDMTWQGVPILVEPDHGCKPIMMDLQHQIAVVVRGACMFIEKVSGLWPGRLALLSLM